MLRKDIEKLVNDTPLADTHEHLVEESWRLKGGEAWALKDLGVLFANYMDADLQSAGMSGEDFTAVMRVETPVEKKWELLKPWYAKAHNTGYSLSVRESLKAMFGIEDITDDNFLEVNQKVHDQIQPGYYRRLLQDLANIDHCQVNSLTHMPQCDTDQPDLLLQDLSTVCMSTGLCVGELCEVTGMEAKTIDDWYQVIDTCFERWGPKAVATKNQSAYKRTIDYYDVPRDVAAPIFERFIRDWQNMTDADTKPLENHLWNYVTRKTVEYNLPNKLHTGYYAGIDHMPMHRLRHNAGDMTNLCAAHPDAKFVFMHITYPYQDEAIAVAKHWHNAYIDMCWAWIINPSASVRFLKEFLMAAPANKILTFGGDYLHVETVVGHAVVARRGITQAVSELVEEGWIKEDAVPDLVRRIMIGNAEELFDLERCRNVPAAA